MSTSAKARRGLRAPVALLIALVALLALPVGASAVHWPGFGGDAGHSGDQPAEAGSMPVTFKYRKAEAGRIQTSVITSAGGPSTTQRMVYGTIRNVGSTKAWNCEVHLQILATGAPVGAETGVDVCGVGGTGNENGFGTRAANGSVTPVESSGPSTLGEVFAIHNDPNSAVTPEADFPTGTCSASNNDIAIAQIDETDGSLVKDVGVGGAKANRANGLETCGSDDPGVQMSDGFVAESSPVLTAPLNANGDRVLFFLAKRTSDSQVRLFKVTISNASAKATTFSYTFKDVTGANPLASPSIAYLRNPSSGSPTPYVVVPQGGAAAGGLTTFRVSDLVAGPAVPPGGGIPQTPASPVTGDGSVPGTPESGITVTPYIYVAYDEGTGTIVRKFQQKIVNNEPTDVLEQVGPDSPAIEGKPSRALALHQEASGTGVTAGGRLVVATGQNLTVLDADTMTVADKFRDTPGEQVLTAGVDGFIRTVPAISGDYIYVAQDNGNQLVLQLSDAERVCSADDLRPECAGKNEFNQDPANTGGGPSDPASTFSIGQPAISRGFIQYTSDRGAFVYRNTDPNQQPPVVEMTKPGPDEKIKGNAVPIAAKATDPDGLGITIVEFFLDPATKPPCDPALQDGKINQDGTPSGDNEYTVPFDSTKCADGIYTISARATDASGQTATDSVTVEINNVDNPKAVYTRTPADNEIPSGTEVTFDASGSAPSAAPASQAITKYEWDWEGDGTYDFEGAPDAAKVVKHTYAIPGVYAPTLRVTQTNGQTETYQQALTVANRPPIASFVATPNPAQSGQEVSFDASASADPEGPVTKYEWDFDGDGAYDLSSASATAKHTYATAGKRTVTLRITDGSGATSTVARDVEVAGPNVPPTASFTVTPNPAVVDQQVTFDGSASRDPDGSIVKYEWDLDGNGQFETSSGSNPRTQRAYATPAVYNVKLRVTDNSGAITETLRQITVSAKASVSAGKKSPRRFTLTAKRKGLTVPVRFATAGKLTLPSGIARVDGCRGRVRITVKAGSKTVASRTTSLTSKCTYKTTVSITAKRLGTAKKLKLGARFAGNTAVKPKSAKALTKKL